MEKVLWGEIGWPDSLGEITFAGFSDSEKAAFVEKVRLHLEKTTFFGTGKEISEKMVKAKMGPCTQMDLRISPASKEDFIAIVIAHLLKYGRLCWWPVAPRNDPAAKAAIARFGICGEPIPELSGGQ